MEHPLFCPQYGSITQHDAWVLEASLLALMPKNPLTVLEIGCYRGSTALGIRRFLDRLSVKLVYWGIDAGLITMPWAPWPEARVFRAKSEDVVHEIPNGWDLIFLDGCHCRKHVTLETLHYGAKVRPGGFLLYHDTSPLAQGKDPQPCGTATDVTGALEEMGWPYPPWRLFLEKYHPAVPFGGMRSYQNGT